MEDIRNIVQDVIEELYQGVHYSHPTSNRNQFPYMDDEDQVRLPEDINPVKDEYLFNKTFTHENDAVHEFPMADFHLGLQIEKNRHDTFDIIEIARVVLDRLEDNPNFYSQISQPSAAE